MKLSRLRWRESAHFLFASALGFGALACSSTPDAELPGAPSGKSDAPGFAVRAEVWHLLADGLSAGDSDYDFSADVPNKVEVVDVWIDRQWAGRFVPDNSQVGGAIDISELSPGTHEVLFQADGDRFAFAARELKVSNPLYVVVSNDWDRSDNDAPMFERQERLHQRHPELVLTHLVGPYTFTDPAVSSARQQDIVDWLRDLEKNEGDEIGLHIHPYCNFVESAGIACQSTPSFAKASDSTGYTVRLGAYSEEEFVTLLEHAVELFEANGLPRPTAFRAGGWTLEAKTMRALSRTGFLADSSAVHWQKLEEWENSVTGTLFQWNREQWGPIGGTTQPYYPNEDDLLSDASPQVDTLEVPDNGALVDYVSADEMIDLFTENYSGEPLSAPVAFSIGYHPPNFSEAFFERMDGALEHIDGHLASADRGPVVYARMSDLAKVWTQR